MGIKTEEEPSRSQKYPFKREYCEKMRKFFDVKPWTIKKVQIKGKTAIIKKEEEIPSKLPLFEDFAKTIKVPTSALREWKDPKSQYYNEEWAETYQFAKDMQKSVLIQNGLRGNYNPLYAKFVTTNTTEFEDKTQVDHTSAGKPVQNVYDWKKLGKEKLKIMRDMMLEARRGTGAENKK